MQIQNMFSQLCGTEAAKNVVFVTTMWDCPDPSRQNNKTEKNLKTDYWRKMILQQARVARFLNNEDSAWRIVTEMILAKCVPGIPLELQVELASGVPLEQTKAALELQDFTTSPSFGVIDHPSSENIDVNQSTSATPSSSQFVDGSSYLNPSISTTSAPGNVTNAEEYISGDTSQVQVGPSTLSDSDMLEPSLHRRAVVESSFADQSGPHLHPVFSEVPGSLSLLPTPYPQSPHSTNATESHHTLSPMIISTVADYLGPIDSIPTSDLREDHLGDHAQSASTSFSSSILHRPTTEVEINVHEVHAVEQEEHGRQRYEQIQVPFVNSREPAATSDEISARSKRSGSTITIMGSSKSSAEVPSSGGDAGAESRSTQPALANTDGSLQDPTRTGASEREPKTDGSTSELVNGSQDSHLQGASTSTSGQENMGAVHRASGPAVSTLRAATEGHNASSLEQGAPNQHNGDQSHISQTDTSDLENSKHIADHPATTLEKPQSAVPFWKKLKDFLLCCCCK